MKSIILRKSDFKNDGMGYGWNDLLEEFGIDYRTVSEDQDIEVYIKEVEIIN